MRPHTGNRVDKYAIASIDILCVVKRHMRHSSKPRIRFIRLVVTCNFLGHGVHVILLF
jgi:hypothetical protein